MTEAEIDLWFALADVAGRMLQPPVLHPMEQQETATDFNRIQLRLLSRPGLRTVGWPGQQTEPKAPDEVIDT